MGPDGDLLPPVEEVTAQQAPSSTAPNSVNAVSSTRNVTLIAVQSPFAEISLESTSEPQVPRRPQPIVAQQPQDSLEPVSSSVILQPLNLSNIATLDRSASGSEGMTAPRHKSCRRPRQPPGRVDVVATFSMTIFIIILFVVTFPVRAEHSADQQPRGVCDHGRESDRDLHHRHEQHGAGRCRHSHRACPLQRGLPERLPEHVLQGSASIPMDPSMSGPTYMFVNLHQRIASEAGSQIFRSLTAANRDSEYTSCTRTAGASSKRSSTVCRNRTRDPVATAGVQCAIQYPVATDLSVGPYLCSKSP